MTALGPLHSEPLNFRPPFDQRPERPFDPDTARWMAAQLAARVAAITDALDGVELGAYDRRMVGWLAGWDDPTVGTWVSLILRARAAGRHSRHPSGPAGT